MQFEKIKESDYASKGVRLLPTTPEMAPDALKRAFDEMMLDVMIPKFNAFLDKLNACIVDQATASSDVLITGKALVNYAVALGAGNMLQEIYDTDRNGVVDNSDMLGGKLPSEYQLTSDDNLLTEIKTIVGAINELKNSIDDVNASIGWYTDVYTIPNGVTTYEYENSILKEDSVIDVYVAEVSKQALKGVDVSFVQADGSLTWNFSTKLTSPVVVTTMRISKAIAAPEPKTTGSIDEVEVTTFDDRLSGEITEKAEEEA